MRTGGGPIDPARPCRLGTPRYAYGDVDSTQAIAHALADAGAPEGTLVLADHQRQGQGRQGRPWHDRGGENLLFSIVLRPTLPPEALPQIPLLASVALAEAIERHAGVRPGIKWPNDLLLREGKLAGVLGDGTVAGQTVGRVILGIGINVNERDFPPDLRAGATSLALETGRCYDRSALLADVLTALERWYDTLRDHGFAPVRAEWCRRAITLGRTVVTGVATGVAVGVDHDGALLVLDAARTTHRVVAGEVERAPGR